MKNLQIIQIVKLIVIFLSFWFIGKKLLLHQNWLISSAFNINIMILIFACSIIYCLTEFLLSFAWKRLLIFCGHGNISQKKCNKIYGQSQIAKYIPGNIFHVLGRHFLGSQAGIKHEVLTGATVYEILGLTYTSLIISFIGIALFKLENIYFTLYQIIFGIITVLILIILIIYLVPYLMKLRGINMLKYNIWESLVIISKIYLFYFIFFFISGLLLVLISSLFLDITYYKLGTIISIFAISWFMGFIIPGAPGGIGIRETVIIYLITPVVGEAESIVIAISLRLITLIGDIWFFLLSKKIFFRSKS